MVLKIVLCGDKGVGKNTLRHKYFGFAFKSQYMTIFGVEFSIKDVKWASGPLAGTSTKAQIWELSIDKEIKDTRPIYYIIYR